MARPVIDDLLDYARKLFTRADGTKVYARGFEADLPNVVMMARAYDGVSSPTTTRVADGPA